MLGQDGLNCSLVLTQLNQGDTLILNLTNLTASPQLNVLNQNYYEWTIDGCTRNFLKYSNGRVTEAITDDINDLDYNTFKQNISICYDFTSHTNELLDNACLLYTSPSPRD